MRRISIAALLLTVLLVGILAASSPAGDQMLNISISGNGSVMVIPVAQVGGSIPLDCAATSCSFPVTTGTMVMVSAVPLPGASSLFTGWTGACTGKIPSCFLIMDSAKSISAQFSTLYFVKLMEGNQNFNTLNDAYAAAVAGGMAHIRAAGCSFAENLILNRNVALTLSGGYDTGFTTTTPTKSTLEGLLTIASGSLTVENLIIDSPSLTITSSTPKNEDSSISIGTPISVSISNRINPATVSSNAVTLIGENQFGKAMVSGVVSYDTNTKTITYSHQELEGNTTYSLYLSGLRDDTGNMIKKSLLSFKTRKDQIKHSIRFNKDGSHFDCVQLFNYYGADTFSRSTPGADGICFTYDETPYLTDNYVLNATGGVASQSHSSLAGGEFLSVAHTYNSSNYRTKTVYTITDKTPQVSGYLIYGYDDKGFLTRITRYNGSGPDLVWFSNDDVVASYQTELYDSQSIKIRSIFYSAPGMDGLWFTGDDTISSYQTYVRDGSGGVKRTVTYTGAGADGLWQTADDLVASYWQNLYDANNMKSKSTHYGATGTDGLWFTADDQVISYDSFQYDADLNPALRTSYGWPGADASWFTGDDIIMTTNEFTWVY